VLTLSCRLGVRDLEFGFRFSLNPRAQLAAQAGRCMIHTHLGSPASKLAAAAAAVT
jgi:hypothetical protein